MTAVMAQPICATVSQPLSPYSDFPPQGSLYCLKSWIDVVRLVAWMNTLLS